MEHISGWHISQVEQDVIGEQLRALALLSRAMEKKLGEQLGVNSTDLAAMEHLIINRQLTPSELATSLNVTTAASTQIIDRLEQMGHVTRERQSRDRRKVSIIPNPMSVTHVFQEIGPVLHGFEAIVAALDSADRAVIERFLGQVIDVYRAAISSVDTPAPPAQPPPSVD